MTENVTKEQFEELAPDVDEDGLDDSVSPLLGKTTEVELPDYDPEVQFDGEDVYDDGDN